MQKKSQFWATFLYGIRCVLGRVARWFVFEPFWRVLQWKILPYFLTISSILRTLEIFFGHLVYFVVIWYIFPRFGILYQEKSGNPGTGLGYMIFLQADLVTLPERWKPYQ
jgi:hypothetical protein